MVVRRTSTSAPPSTLFSLTDGPPSLFSDGCGTGFAGSVLELASHSPAFHEILFMVDLAFGLVGGYNLDLQDYVLWLHSCSAAFPSVSPLRRWVGGRYCVAPSCSSAALPSFVSLDRQPSFDCGGAVVVLFCCWLFCSCVVILRGGLFVMWVSSGLVVGLFCVCWVVFSFVCLCCFSLLVLLCCGCVFRLCFVNGLGSRRFYVSLNPLVVHCSTFWHVLFVFVSKVLCFVSGLGSRLFISSSASWWFSVQLSFCSVCICFVVLVF